MDAAFYIVRTNSIANTNSARAYGLVKVHKKVLPVHIIVSTKNSSTYFLDKAISRFFNKYLPRPKSSLRKSSELPKSLSSLNVPDEYCLVFFDVVSLFTNIQIDFVISNFSSTAIGATIQQIWFSCPFQLTNVSSRAPSYFSLNASRLLSRFLLVPPPLIFVYISHCGIRWY